MTLAEEFVTAFNEHYPAVMEEALSWGVDVEETEEDSLYFFHFSDGSTAGVRRGETYKTQVWIPTPQL